MNTPATPSPDPSGTSLIPLGQDAAHMKAAVAAQRAQSTREITAIQESMAAARVELDARRAEVEAAYRREVAALEAQMAPMKAQLAKLTEVAWTVDLYLGRDEQIELLVDGEPAPADTPIHIRQMVLAMDEESLVLLESGGLDARNVQAFLDWVTASPANRDRVIPDRKGVVVLVPSRQARDYGDPWANKSIAEANECAHWLIRNGERLYLLRTDPNLYVGERLVPTRSEFVDFFYAPARPGQDRQPLEPGSAAWVHAEEAADRRRRHFMRLMLVLQGLVDRTVAFAPLPQSGVNLLSVSAQDDGKVVIVNELDNVLTSGREPFRAWQRRLCAQLRPGMRIVADFDSAAFKENEFRPSSYERRHGNERLRPHGASVPQSLVPHVIEDRGEGGSFVIRYARTDRIWVDRYVDGHWVGDADPKTRASCRLYPDDSFILPYDLVTEAEMLTYLDARTERHHYLDMVPVLRAAIAAKRAEAAAEEPFRAMLTGILAAEHAVAPGDVEADIADLVHWWKLTNRWARPLTGDPAAEAKAVKAISKEWASRRKAAAAAAGVGATDEAMAAAGRRVPGAVTVVRRRDGRYVALSPSEADQRVWLTQTTLKADGAPGEVKEWTILTGATLASMTVLWSAPAWNQWDHAASRADHLTGPEREAVLADLTARAAQFGPPIAATYRADAATDGGHVFAVYAWDELPDPGREEHRARYHRGVGVKLVRVACRWKRGTGGRVVTTDLRDERGTHWGKYHADGAPERPWRPEGSQYASASDFRPVWADPAQLERVDQVAAELASQSRQEQAVIDARNTAVAQIMGRVRAAWLEQKTAQARARFDEDYADAPDLWEHHLGTLALERKWTEPSGLRAVFARCVDAGVDVTGLTVAQAVAAASDGPAPKVSDVVAALVITPTDPQ